MKGKSVMGSAPDVAPEAPQRHAGRALSLVVLTRVAISWL